MKIVYCWAITRGTREMTADPNESVRKLEGGLCPHYIFSTPKGFKDKNLLLNMLDIYQTGLKDTKQHLRVTSKFLLRFMPWLQIKI